MSVKFSVVVTWSGDSYSTRSEDRAMAYSPPQNVIRSFALLERWKWKPPPPNTNRRCSTPDPVNVASVPT